MCGWSQLVSGHKEATSYPRLTLVPLSVFCGETPVAVGQGGAKSRLSRVSFSQIYWH